MPRYKVKKTVTAECTRFVNADDERKADHKFDEDWDWKEFHILNTEADIISMPIELQAAVEKEAEALKEFNAKEGKLILLKRCCAMDERDNTVDVVFNSPALFLVSGTDETSIVRYCDDWLDPIWEVEAMEERDELKGLRSFWIHADSYNTKTCETATGDMYSDDPVRFMTIGLETVGYKKKEDKKEEDADQ